MAKNQVLDFIVEILNEEYNVEGEAVYKESLLIHSIIGLTENLLINLEMKI